MFFLIVSLSWVVDSCKLTERLTFSNNKQVLLLAEHVNSHTCCLNLEYEYHLFIDKREHTAGDTITALVQQYLPASILEQQSNSHMTYGIPHEQVEQMGALFHALDVQREQIGIDGYGLSTATIEEVFLK
jgi:flagellar basal body L-ring protein FlgH